MSSSSQLRLFVEDDFLVRVGGLTLTPVFDAVTTDISLRTELFCPSHFVSCHALCCAILTDPLLSVVP